MVPGEWMEWVVWLTIAATPLLLGPKLISALNQRKGAIYTQVDVNNLRKSHDLEVGHYKGTINRIRATQTQVEKVPAQLLAKANATAANGGDAVNPAAIDELADEILNSIPVKWRAIFSPIKGGVVNAIKEKEAKDPGAMSKAVQGIAGKLGTVAEQAASGEGQKESI